MASEVSRKFVIVFWVVAREVTTFWLLIQVTKKSPYQCSLKIRRDSCAGTYVAPGSVGRVPIPTVASILMRPRSARFESKRCAPKAGIVLAFLVDPSALAPVSVPEDPPRDAWRVEDHIFLCSLPLLPPPPTKFPPPSLSMWRLGRAIHRNPSPPNH
jgi:hypothetical protein